MSTILQYARLGIGQTLRGLSPSRPIRCPQYYNMQGQELDRLGGVFHQAGLSDVHNTTICKVRNWTDLEGSFTKQAY